MEAKDDIGHVPQNRDLEFQSSVKSRSLTMNPLKRHELIADILHLELEEQDNEIEFILSTLLGICDPVMQPEETEDCILSLDLLADVLIGLIYSYKNNNKSQDSSGGEDPDLEINALKFDISVALFKILRVIQKQLHVDDELVLSSCSQNAEWVQKVELWLPDIALSADEKNLRLCYCIVCVIIISLYKLFKPTDGSAYNLVLNPYLQYLIKVWKCYTNVIVLGIALDRIYLEKEAELPDNIKVALKGASSVRYTLAWVLNQNPSSIASLTSNGTESNEQYYMNDYDIKKEGLSNFMEPMARQVVNGGSLSIDMRLLLIALLIIDSGISYAAGQIQPDKLKFLSTSGERILNQSKPIAELGDLLVDLEYDDQFDDDMQYIFEYELEDEEEEIKETEKEEVEDKGSEKLKDSFIQDKTSQATVNDDYKVEGEKSRSVDDNCIQTAIRSKDGMDHPDFDEEGNDWRDIPRGLNSKFEAWFLKKYNCFCNESEKEKLNSDDFLGDWMQTEKALKFLTVNCIEDNTDLEEKIGQVLINTIAKCVKEESDGLPCNTDSCTPDKIYAFWTSPALEDDIALDQANGNPIVPILSITRFELLLHNNNKLARSMMDEMLMCSGYRRVLIWFLTHNLNLSSSLIDYFYELVTGARFTKNRNKPYKFSRKGDSIILSDVEQSMLLHEFFTNASVYLSATEGLPIDDDYKVVLSEPVARKLMSFICLMIESLITKGIIKLNSRSKKLKEDLHNYTTELQVLLISWIGKIPDARELFFKIKKSTFSTDRIEPKEREGLEEEISSESDLVLETSNLLKKFFTMPIIEVSESIDKHPKYAQILEGFAMRLQSHLDMILNFQLGSKPLETINPNFKEATSDFELFLRYFNVFSKIDYFADLIFGKFENIFTTGKLGNETELDSEFSELFLNGEGRFSDPSEIDK